MILALMLAQAIVPTPVPISATPTPAPLSERTMLARGLDDAAAKARALGGTLGAVVIDLGNEVSAQTNGEQSLPMQSLQKLPIAVIVYQAIEGGKLRTNQIVHVQQGDLVPQVSRVAADYAKRTDYSVAELTALMLEESDNSAAMALSRLVGGVDAINARLRQLNYYGILIGRNDDGFAKPLAFAQFLSDLQGGKLLSAEPERAVLGMLARSTTFPGRLRAGFPAGTLVEHKTGTSATNAGVTDATNDAGIVTTAGHRFVIVAMLQGARGDEAARDAVIASVARAAHDAALQFPL